MAVLDVFRPSAEWRPDIVYEDDALLILEKPANMLSVPGKAEDMKDSLLSRAEQFFAPAFLVHRLDCATSGLMMFAKSKQIQKELSILFQQRKIQKTYIADVTKPMPIQAGLIDVPLRCDWPNRPKQMVDWHQGKPSLTQWEQAPHSPNRVYLYPITGRSHQLRVHLQWLGSPIAGDRLYSDCSLPNQPERMHLHAHTLSLAHPVTREPLSITSTCPFESPYV